MTLPFVLIFICLLLLTRYIRNESSWYFLSYSELTGYFHTLAAHRGNFTFSDKAAFALIVFLATVSSLPVTLFEFAAGFIFQWEALLIALPAKVAGSITSFFIGRYCWRDILEHRLRGYALIEGIESAIENDEWRIVFLVRLMSLPQWLRNYAMSLLNVRFKVFACSCCVVCTIHSVIATFIGLQSSRLLSDMTQGGTVALIFFALYILIFIAGFAWITAVVRREVEKLNAAIV